MIFELLLSDVAGWIPTVAQMDRKDVNNLSKPILAWNRKDGILYGLQIYGDAKTVIAVNSTTIQTVLDGKISSDTSFTSDNSIIRVDGTGRVVQQSYATIDDQGSINIPIGQTYNIDGVPLEPDKYYQHIQSIPAVLWNVFHELGKYPSVTVIDSYGIEYEGEVSHTDENNLTLTFSAMISGFANCN